MVDDKRILQVIPVDGWRVEYEFGGETQAVPLLFLALVERTDRDGDAWTSVDGLDVDCDGLFELVSNVGNFKRIIPPYTD